MSQKLKEAARPIVFSLCEWGNNKPWLWAREIGHLWRTTGDIYDCFDCIKDHGTWKSLGVMHILDLQDGLREYAGPSHWNDPDMMEVGNGGMSLNEDRAHFSMWAMLAAPLIAGNDLRSMSKQTLEILINNDVIAINQDSLGIQALKYKAQDSLEYWIKPLSKGAWALCFLNRSTENKSIEIDWANTVVEDSFAKRTFDGSKQNYTFKDVWTKKEMGTTQKPLKTNVPSHDVLMLYVKPVN